MNKFTILEISQSEIDETLQTGRKERLIETATNGLSIYLKNFDYCYAMIIKRDDDDTTWAIKLPVKFVDAMQETELRYILRQFLQQAGIPLRTEGIIVR